MPPEFILLQNQLDSYSRTVLPFGLDHRKIVVVDGTQALVCTFNLGRDYLYELPYGPSLHENFWLDAMLEIRGPAVAAVQKMFAERWMLSGGDVFTRSFTASQSDPFTPVIAQAGSDRVALVGSGYGTKEQNEIRNEIELKCVDAGTVGKPIVVVNPYICDDGLIDLLVSRAQTGSAVSVLCADHHLDNPWSRDAGHLRFKRMLDAGIVVCEYPGRMLHAKLMVIGNDWTTIGSYNWNYRSGARDLECNAVVQSQTLAADVLRRVAALSQEAGAVQIPDDWSTKPLNEYPLGCMTTQTYDSLPAEVRENLETSDLLSKEVLTSTLEKLEVL